MSQSQMASRVARQAKFPDHEDIEVCTDRRRYFERYRYATPRQREHDDILTASEMAQSIREYPTGFTTVAISNRRAGCRQLVHTSCRCNESA